MHKVSPRGEINLCSTGMFDCTTRHNRTVTVSELQMAYKKTRIRATSRQLQGQITGKENV